MTDTQVICQQVIDTAVRLADLGFLAGTGGNVAIRVDPDTFAITPSASDYYVMTADEVCVLKLQDLSQVGGSKLPSVEKGLHAKIFTAIKKCQVSIHTHQPIASAFTLLNQKLKPITKDQRLVLGGDVPVAGYAPSGTSWLANNVSKLLRPDVYAYLMRNHGVVCWGTDIEDACRVVNTLEETARQQFMQTISNYKSKSKPDLQNQVNELLAV